MKTREKTQLELSRKKAKIERVVELFAENIISAGKSFLSQPMEKPFIPSWQRIEYASPGFIKKSTP